MYGLKSVRKNLVPNSVPQGRLKVAQDVPGFPVGVGGENEPHAAFREESRTRRYV
jgi:hypothetical protein